MISNVDYLNLYTAKSMKYNYTLQFQSKKSK